MTCFLITQSEASISISVFSMDHEMRHLINFFTLYKSSIEHSIELPENPILPKVHFPSLNATAYYMAAKLRNHRFYIILRLASMY